MCANCPLGRHKRAIFFHKMCNKHLTHECLLLVSLLRFRLGSRKEKIHMLVQFMETSVYSECYFRYMYIYLSQNNLLAVVFQKPFPQKSPWWSAVTTKMVAITHQKPNNFFLCTVLWELLSSATTHEENEESCADLPCLTKCITSVILCLDRLLLDYYTFFLSL